MTKSEVTIGWATRDVSTDKPVSIIGQFYARISEGCFDPILVNALVIDNGENLAIFVSADIVVIRNSLLDHLRERVAERDSSIPVDKIIMNATHTHTGPSTYGDQWNDIQSGSSSVSFEELPMEEIKAASNDEYRDFFLDQAADAIVEAFTSRQSGGIAYGYGYAVVAHSRRMVYLDDVSQRPGAVVDSTHGVNGHAQMYGNTNDEQFSHYEAGADPFINLLYTFDLDGNLTGAIVNIPCPSQNSEQSCVLSASYWNEIRQAIRAKHGDIHILAQSGAAGDLSPRINHYQKAQERRFQLKYGTDPEPIAEYNARRDIAERVANAFDEVLAWARKDIQTSLQLTHVVKTVHLDKRRITSDEAKNERVALDELMQRDFQKDGTPEERLFHDSILLASRARCQRILERFESQDKEPSLPTELHIVSIGDIAFATNRFELFMDYMHRIQARSPFTQTFIVQLTGVPGADGGTYLATERGAWGKGYSASRYCNIVSPKGGQELVNETVATLNDIYERG